MNMNPYLGVRKVVNFNSVFFQLIMCCTKNLSEQILINMIFRKIMPVARYWWNCCSSGVKPPIQPIGAQNIYESSPF